MCELKSCCRCIYDKPHEMFISKNGREGIKTRSDCRSYYKEVEKRCEHNRILNCCKECRIGNTICCHNKFKHSCIDCGSKSVCVHKKIKTHCKKCDGGSICLHKRERVRCRECKEINYIRKLFHELPLYI
jgi:hypothetical protein